MLASIIFNMKMSYSKGSFIFSQSAGGELLLLFHTTIIWIIKWFGKSIYEIVHLMKKRTIAKDIKYLCYAIYSIVSKNYYWNYKYNSIETSSTINLWTALHHELVQERHSSFFFQYDYSLPPLSPRMIYHGENTWTSHLHSFPCEMQHLRASLVHRVTTKDRMLTCSHYSIVDKNTEIVNRYWNEEWLTKLDGGGKDRERVETFSVIVSLWDATCASLIKNPHLIILSFKPRKTEGVLPWSAPIRLRQAFPQELEYIY